MFDKIKLFARVLSNTVTYTIQTISGQVDTWNTYPVTLGSISAQKRCCIDSV